jgi:DNA (cytosine-5)-methyltransferase 1
MKQRIQAIMPGEGMKSAYERLVKEGKEVFAKSVFPNKLYAARNRRLLLTEPSFTVTSHCLDEMIHPLFDRGMTPREVARLQSFPDWYQFEGPFVKFHSDPEQDQYEQIGDAIPPLLAYALGREVVKTLKSINSHESK